MTAYLLAGLLRLLAAAQFCNDGSGMLPLYKDQAAAVQVVWCAGSCAWLDGGEYVGNTLQWSRIPLAPVNQDDYSPYEALDLGEYR